MGIYLVGSPVCRVVYVGTVRGMAVLWDPMEGLICVGGWFHVLADVPTIALFELLLDAPAAVLVFLAFTLMS